MFSFCVMYRTYVIVDEKGVRAGKRHSDLISIFIHLYLAAASVVRVMVLTGAGGRPVIPIPFRCDKPFLYAIRYNQTILFIGRYVKAIDSSNMPPFIYPG